MFPNGQMPQVEFLTRDQVPIHADSIVIRKVESSQYYVEQTNVILGPALDSMLNILYLDGELKNSQLTVPEYNFRTHTGHTVTVTSEAGELRTVVS